MAFAASGLPRASSAIKREPPHGPLDDVVAERQAYFVRSATRRANEMGSP
jgi:hypothetical protein